jgi:hypothetical protein
MTEPMALRVSSFATAERNIPDLRAAETEHDESTERRPNHDEAARSHSILRTRALVQVG